MRKHKDETENETKWALEIQISHIYILKKTIKYRQNGEYVGRGATMNLLDSINLFVLGGNFWDKR